MTTQFAIGNTYHARSIGDSNCIFTFQIIERTDKFVTVQDEQGKVFKKKITIHDDCETILPLGSYSMAPILRANNVVVVELIGDFEVTKCVIIAEVCPEALDVVDDLANFETIINEIKDMDQAEQAIASTPSINPEQAIAPIPAPIQSEPDANNMPRIINHMSPSLCNWEKEIWIKAIENKAAPHQAYLCIDAWFDYKNNPSNTIDPEFKELMIDTIEKNKMRILNAVNKVVKIAEPIQSEPEAELTEPEAVAVPCEVETPYKVMIQLSLVSYVKPVRYTPEVLQPRQLSLV